MTAFERAPTRRPLSLRRHAAMKPFARFLFAALAALAFSAVAFAAPTDAEQVIVPNSGAGKSAPAPGVGTGGGAFTVAAVILLAGAGGWLLWRGRGGKLAMMSRTSRQLAIEETRSLGNRQYLVVATYQDKKFLLGVCPGRIDLLSPLHDGTAPSPAKERS